MLERREKRPISESVGQLPWKICLQNVSTELSDRDIFKLFNVCGHIKDLAHGKAPNKTGNKRLLFIIYFFKEDAELAIQSYNGYILKNKPLVVKMADNQPKDSDRIKSTDKEKIEFDMDDTAPVKREELNNDSRGFSNLISITNPKRANLNFKNEKEVHKPYSHHHVEKRYDNYMSYSAPYNRSVGNSMPIREKYPPPYPKSPRREMAPNRMQYDQKYRGDYHRSQYGMDYHEGYDRRRHEDYPYDRYVEDHYYDDYIGGGHVHDSGYGQNYYNHYVRDDMNYNMRPGYGNKHRMQDDGYTGRNDRNDGYDSRGGYGRR